jgi:hypothetical protein
VSHGSLSDSASESRRVRRGPMRPVSQRSDRGRRPRRPATPARPGASPVLQQAPRPTASERRPFGRTSRQEVPDIELTDHRSGCSGKSPSQPSASPPGCKQSVRPKGARDTQPPVRRSRGCSVVSFYNEVRPHSALGGRTPSLIRLPPSSPASRPLRVASGDGLRPALTQAACDGANEHGRDGENGARPNRETPSTIGVTATADSTSEWREVGAQVTMIVSACIVLADN